VSIKEAFSHNCIILDACCIINLFASGKMKDILEAIPKNLAVATYVKEREAKVFYENKKPIEIDLHPFIVAKLLRLVDIETDVEANLYVNFSERLDDGEAITGAIAINRNWAIATDERKSTTVFRNYEPQIAVVSTLDMVKYWADMQRPSAAIIQDSLSNIRLKGKYEPYKNHPLIDWWRKYM
jgi:predicted nucleic acid-binding protein